MDSLSILDVSSEPPRLLWNKRKPFSSLVKIISLIAVGCTVITILKSGFLWTFLFALVITVIGAASFLVIADDENGGIAAETKKVLSSAESPFVQRIARLFYSLNSKWTDKFAAVSSKASKEKMVEPNAVISSANLERLHPWYNLKIPKLIDDALLSLTKIIVHGYALKDWYGIIQVRKTFVTELELAIRHASSLLIRRLRTVKYPVFLVERILPAFVDHISVFLSVRSLQKADSVIDLQALLTEQPHFFHPALADQSGKYSNFHKPTYVVVASRTTSVNS